MFRAACLSSRTPLAASIRSPRNSVGSRSISEDAKQEIAQRLLQQKPFTHVDEVTFKKRQQWEAAIGASIPLRRPTDSDGGQYRATYLAPGQHLLYCNTTVPTEQLLPDGTDTAFSPPAPWSSRLWAGGRIQFPKPYEIGILESPRLVLAEYVRDVRITGPEGQEKIFVKIERRVGKLDAGRSTQVGHGVARNLKRRTEDDTGNSLVVETRDLCFLREKGSNVPFERRHISPPTNPDYSHSLTPTPALLFRFSALTNNAHAIHIDPEYTRNVYGFPNLLVHGPLTLTLMLEYVRQLLFNKFGVSHDAPIVTEINYRNLAPLFANEEMTICVKKKGYMATIQPSPASPTTEASVEGPTSEIPTLSGSEDKSVPSTEDNSHEPNSTSPLRAITTESGIDIGKGFPTPSSEEDPMLNEQADYFESKFSPPPTMFPEADTASNEKQYPQEWDVWIQSGQGEEASLAVRGTVKIEIVDRPERSPPTMPRVDNTRSTGSKLTEEENEMLQKVKSMLERKQEGGGLATSQARLKKNKNKLRTLTAAETPVDSTKGSNEATVPITRVVLTHSKRVTIRSVRTDDTSVRFTPHLTIQRRKTKAAPFKRVSHLIIRPHNSKVAYNVARGVNLYDVRYIESSDGIRFVKDEDGLKEMLKRRADESCIAVQEYLSNQRSASPVDGSKTVAPATGAFERTLRVMLEGT